MTKMPMYGRGFARMKKRLGPKRAEALRQQVLKEQADALAEVRKERAVVEARDRETYKTYPKPRRH